jgi:hypothetical protein
MEFLHPSISSRIIDNSTVFVTAQGATNLFCAFTSDQGEDNVVKYVSSPTEFLFNYGSLNFRKHGQAMYNVRNWTTSGGGAYCLRVMPGDAGYAHAIINIQTKTGSKDVTIDGDTFAMPDVAVRTTAYYNSVNNVSVAALEALLSTETAGTTIDGFTNHLLLGIYPKGRGEKYNDLGFKLQLSDKFDNTYNFRVYSFEGYRLSPIGALEVLESPLMVSLDPDAIGNDGQSMFIKNVVEKYSLYFNVIFNEEAYDALGAVINAEVNPQVLDYFNGISRIVGGSPEVYTSSVTSTSLDVHVAVQKYSDGEPVILGDYNATNYVNADDLLEYAMVERDDSARAAIYASKLNSVTNMRLALAAVKEWVALAAPFKALVADTNKIIPGYTLSPTAITAGAGSLSTPYAAFIAATTGDRADYITKTAANDNAAKKVAADAMMTKLMVLINATTPILDYTSAVSGVGATAAISLKINAAINSIRKLEGYDLQVTGKKLALDAVVTAVAETLTSGEATQLAAVDAAMLIIDDAKALAASLEITDDTSGNTLKSATEALILALDGYYADATDANIIGAAHTTAVSNAVSGVATTVTSLKSYLDVVIVEKMVSLLDPIVLDTADGIEDGIILASITLFEAARAAAVLTEAGPKAALIATIGTNITAGQTQLQTALSNTYNLQLQNFDNYVSFTCGSDGSIADGAAGRATTINNLLISAYQGTLDPSLTNKRDTPFDLVLDANYNTVVKNAIVTLCTEIRDDVMGIVDTGITANPQQAIDYRRGSMTVNDYRVAIYTQNLAVYDEFSGKNIPVTSPYFLAEKIPQNDVQYGMHYPLAGKRRGTITGFIDKSLSWNPTDTAQEELYKRQINYIVQDSQKTMFNSQSTSQLVVSALSNISVVRALLRIKRDVEALSEDYQFEFNQSSSMSSFQTSLNNYLSGWVTNSACQSISGTVYASAYDKLQKIARVRIDVIFTSIIERIMIDLVVGK